MLVTILFWSGLIMCIVTGFLSWTRPGKDKTGVTFFPATLLIAAIAAKYIGL